MKLIDRYIIRQFLSAFAASIAGFIVLFLAIDMTEKLDKFIDRGVGIDIIVEYYLNFLPQMIALVLPVGILLGALMATGRMSQNSEITAMRSGGVSLYRLMTPFVIIGIVAAFAATYLNGWFAPTANARMLAITREYLKDKMLQSVEYNLHLQNAPGEFVVVGNFAINQGRAERVGIYTFKPTDRTKLIKRIDALQMNWDTASSMWRLTDASERTFTDSGKETFRYLPENESRIKLNFTPQDLRDRQLATNETSEITVPDLKRRIDLAKRAGKDTSRDEVDYYSKFSLGFSAIIVILFAVPFAAQRKRGGLAVQFAVAIGITFVYLAFVKISFTFGYSGELNPLLTAWLANIIFGLLAAVVLVKVRK